MYNARIFFVAVFDSPTDMLPATIESGFVNDLAAARNVLDPLKDPAMSPQLYTFKREGDFVVQTITTTGKKNYWCILETFLEVRSFVRVSL